MATKRKRNLADSTMRNVRAANKRLEKLEGSTNSFATAWDIRDLQAQINLLRTQFAEFLRAGSKPIKRVKKK
jgi:hypothetical protein